MKNPANIGGFLFVPQVTNRGTAVAECVIRVEDISHIEHLSDGHSFVSIRGNPTVTIAIAMTPRQIGSLMVNGGGSSVSIDKILDKEPPHDGQ